MQQVACELLPSALRDRCRAVPTASWSDALDAHELPGVLSGIERRSGKGRVVGPATTVFESVTAFGGYEVDDFALGRVLDQANAGDVLVLQVGTGGECISTLGGLAGKRSLARGVEGVVIDGGCRDVEDLRAMQLAVASSYVTPVSGKRRVRVEAINCTIRCGEVEINPGDVIVADETGVVAVPMQRLVAVLETAEELTRMDARFESMLDAGRSFGEISAALQHL
jgi:regulator of RNase E activity RraA